MPEILRAKPKPDPLTTRLRDNFPASASFVLIQYSIAWKLADLHDVGQEEGVVFYLCYLRSHLTVHFQHESLLIGLLTYQIIEPPSIINMLLIHFQDHVRENQIGYQQELHFEETLQFIPKCSLSLIAGPATSPDPFSVQHRIEDLQPIAGKARPLVNADVPISHSAGFGIEVGTEVINSGLTEP